MNCAGIISEYNPFHMGHARQFRLTRERLGSDSAIICLMSGNYVQRGEPAMWDKGTRARAALDCGANLVLELPVTGVLQSAEGFARTGVEILTRLGCVTHLSFGSECGDEARLMALAKQLDDPACPALLQAGLKDGLSYAAARQRALGDHQGLLTTPNNILGLEYCRAIHTLGSSLQPLSIARSGDYHATVPDPEEPSATAVRRLFPQGRWAQLLPPASAGALRDAPWYDLKFGERAMLARLRGLSPQQWEACAHGSEGLWSKVRKAVLTQPDLESVLQASKSKRYPRTRLQRLLLCAYLGLSAEDLHRPIPYVRILAADSVGCTLLRQAKDLEQLPLINAGQRPQNADYYALECRATDLFTLFAAPGFPCSGSLEQSARPYVKKN